MSVLDGQKYKEIVQLALRAEKLTSERMSRGKFKKKGIRIYVRIVIQKES